MMNECHKCYSFYYNGKCNPEWCYFYKWMNDPQQPDSSKLSILDQEYNKGIDASAFEAVDRARAFRQGGGDEDPNEPSWTKQWSDIMLRLAYDMITIKKGYKK